MAVTKNTLAGSYNLQLETYVSRHSEDTVVYTDTLTVVVTYTIPEADPDADDEANTGILDAAVA